MTGPSAIENPYVGPRTFEEADGDHFFGREVEARALLSLVVSEPLVLFYAQSGAGKSSLLNARLIPRLRERGFTVLPTGRVGGALPDGLGPVGNVFTYHLLSSLDRGESPASELQDLTLAGYLERTAERDDDGGAAYRVLVIDQFEEIVTTNLARWRDRDDFFRQLNQALRNDDRLWVVLTMREDHAAALAPYTRLLTERMRARFYMQRMEAPAALDAIRQPAAQAGRPFATGVAEALVDNLRQIRTHDGQHRLGQFVEPVQLQVVCYQLWQQLAGRPPGPITFEDVEQLGDVDRALAQFYEEALASVLQETGAAELQLRNWFDQHLITEAGTRGTVYLGADRTAGMETEVVKALADRFLLRAEIRAGGTWFELIHDRFVGPILEANERWRLAQSPLLVAASAWDRAGRRRDLLYQGEQLAAALATTNRQAADPLVQAFLDAGEAAQSQHDLVEAEARAAAQAQRAEMEARSAQRMRRISIVSLFLFAIGVLAAGLAVAASNRAATNREAAEAAGVLARAEQGTAEAASTLAVGQQRAAEAASTLAWGLQATAASASNFAEAQRATAVAARDEVEEQEAVALAASTRAVEQQALAEAARVDAVVQQREAITASTEAEMRRRLLLSQTLAFHALTVAQRTQDSELVTLLLLEAAAIRDELPAQEIAGTPEVERLEQTMAAAARLVVTMPAFNVTFRGATGAIRALALTADGQAVIAAAGDGSITSWSLASPGGPPETIAAGDVPADYVAMTPDGRIVAFGRRGGSISVWRLDEPGSPPLALDAEAPLLSLALSADGASLAASTEARDLLRWDLRPAEPVRRRLPDTHAAGFHNLIFAPGTDTLYALAPSTPRSFVYTWFGDGSPTIDVPFLPLAFSPDGSLAAFGNPNPTLFPVGDDLLMVARTATTNFFLTGVPDRALRPPLSLSGDNQLLADTRGNRVRLWRLRAGGSSGSAQIGDVLGGHTDDVTALAFTPEMSLLAGTANGSVRLWRPNTLESFAGLLGQGCSQVGRNLSWEEWQSYVGEEPYRRTCGELPAHWSVPAP